MSELTNIIKKDGVSYSIDKLIYNGVEYNIKGGEDPSDIEKLLTIENIFTPKKITLTDSISNSGGSVSIVEDFGDFVSNDSSKYFHFFMTSEPVSSSVKGYYIRNISKTETGNVVLSSKIVGYTTEGTGANIVRTGLFRAKQYGTSGYKFSYLIYQNHYNGEDIDYVIWSSLNSDGSINILTTTENNEISDEVLQAWINDCGITDEENIQPFGYTSILIKNGTSSGLYTTVIATHKPLKPEEYGEDYIEAILNNGKIPLGECYYSIDGGEFLYSESGGTPIISGEHVVKVVPVDINTNYASLFVYNGSNTPRGIIKLLHDAPFKRYNSSQTNISDGFKKYQFKGCDNLISVPKESVTIPNTITTIGNDYMYGMFEGCTSLNNIPFIGSELPDSVENIGNNYMYGMFKGCTALGSIDDLILGNGVKNIGNYFKAYQYQNCTSLLNSSKSTMPCGLLSIGTYCMTQQYYGCKLMTTAGDEEMPDSINSIGVNYKYRQYYGCVKLLYSEKEIINNCDTKADLLTIGDNYKNEQYNGCTSLAKTSEESMPNVSIAIGNNYKRSQFIGCTGLKELSNEVVSNSILSIGQYYRAEQYSSSANIKNAAKEISTGDNNSEGTTIGDYFKYKQYLSNIYISNAGEETLPGNTKTIGNYYRANMFQGCTNLYNAAYEYMPNSVTSIGNYFRYYQYSNIKAESLPPEILSNSLTSIGNYFRAYQFYQCASLVSSSKESLPDSINSIGTYFRSNQYANNTVLSEVSLWKDLSIGNSYYRQNQFNGSNTLKDIYVSGGVGYASYSTSTLNNSYVGVVYVEPGKFEEFTTATTLPWSSITFSKYIELIPGQIIYKYTGKDEVFDVEETGLYNFKVYGAGSNSASGGLTEGTIQLNKGDKLTMVVGQNGGSSKAGTYGFGGAGTTNYNAGGGLSGVFLGDGSVTANDSSRALLIAGGAGAGPSGKGGNGGGENGSDGIATSYGVIGSGGTQTGHGTSGNISEDQFSGGKGTNTYGNGGGGGRWGGNGGTGDTSGNDDSGAGGGSGYIAEGITGEMTIGGANNINGNGKIIINIV